MPEYSTCPGDGKRKPFQHAAEVTQKKKMADAEDGDEEAPVFTRPKIGGAKDVLGKSFEVADATSINAGPKRDFRAIGGVRAEDTTLADRTISRSEHPVHLMRTQPGWRRHWATLTNDQAWFWTDLSKVFISDFCKACLEAGTRCDRGKPAPHQYGGQSSKFTCQDCRLPGSCYWLIAYKAHPLEDTDHLAIPDYTSRLLARQNSSAIGTALEIPESAVVIPKKPEVPVKVKLPDTRARTAALQPRPTYSMARDAYEDLVAWEYDDQCKRRGWEKPINWNSQPSYWETEVAMGRFGDRPLHTANRGSPREKPVKIFNPVRASQRRERNQEKAFIKWDRTRRARQYSHALIFPRDTRLDVDEVMIGSSLAVVIFQDLLVHKLLLWLLPPPKFVFGEHVRLRHKSRYMAGSVTNRKLDKTWMYRVSFRRLGLFDPTSRYHPSFHNEMWWPEYYLRSVRSV